MCERTSATASARLLLLVRLPPPPRRTCPSGSRTCAQHHRSKPGSQQILGLVACTPPQESLLERRCPFLGSSSPRQRAPGHNTHVTKHTYPRSSSSRPQTPPQCPAAHLTAHGATRRGCRRCVSLLVGLGLRAVLGGGAPLARCALRRDAAARCALRPQRAPAARARGGGPAAARGQAHDRGSPSAGGAAAAACRRPRRGGPARVAAACQLAWRGSHARARAPTAPRGRPCTQGARAPKAPRGRPCKQGARARCARARRGRSVRARLPGAPLPRRAARWGGRAAAVREAPPCPCLPACRPRPSPGAPRGAAGCLLRMQSHQLSPRRSRSGWKPAPVCW